jgi:hypothetical protein
MQQQRRTGIDARTAHLEEVGLRLGPVRRAKRTRRRPHAATVVDIAAAAEVAPRTAPLY